VHEDSRTPLQATAACGSGVTSRKAPAGKEEREAGVPVSSCVRIQEVPARRRGRQGCPCPPVFACRKCRQGGEGGRGARAASHATPPRRVLSDAQGEEAVRWGTPRPRAPHLLQAAPPAAHGRAIAAEGVAGHGGRADGETPASGQPSPLSPCETDSEELVEEQPQGRAARGRKWTARGQTAPPELAGT
jgi:hypothetical protein